MPTETVLEFSTPSGRAALRQLERSIDARRLKEQDIARKKRNLEARLYRHNEDLFFNKIREKVLEDKKRKAEKKEIKIHFYKSLVRNKFDKPTAQQHIKNIGLFSDHKSIQIKAYKKLLSPPPEAPPSFASAFIDWFCNKIINIRERYFVEHNTDAQFTIGEDYFEQNKTNKADTQEKEEQKETINPIYSAMAVINRR